MPSSACEPDLAIVPSSSSLLDNTPFDSSSNTDSDDENPPPLIPPLALAPPTTSQIPRWVHSTREVVGDLAGDPTYQCQTCSLFQRDSSLLDQVSENYDPDTFAEALGHPEWDATMKEKYNSLLANDTWDLEPLLKGRRLVRCKWVYITKYGPNGSDDKHKAKLVAKGFSQVEGIAYTETCARIAKMNSTRLVLALSTS